MIAKKISWLNCLSDVSIIFRLEVSWGPDPVDGTKNVQVGRACEKFTFAAERKC